MSEITASKIKEYFNVIDEIKKLNAKKKQLNSELMDFMEVKKTECIKFGDISIQKKSTQRHKDAPVAKVFTLLTETLTKHNPELVDSILKDVFVAVENERVTKTTTSLKVKNNT